VNYRNKYPSDWEQSGLNQLNVLIENGLKKDMKLLDVGCGELRGGVHFIKYLDPYNYYGIDSNYKFIEDGIKYELGNLQNKVDSNNFLVTDNFDIEKFKIKFDMGIVNSVFKFLSKKQIINFLFSAYENFKPNSSLIISHYESEIQFLNEIDIPWKFEKIKGFPLIGQSFFLFKRL
jgi:2-polyprenyl-3-methyl-5-hydroxy-6-metoxy-1,4-benzoquinol methylase